MTKQEEIGVKTKKWIDNRFGPQHHFNLQLMWDYLKFLDENNVVIKVDRELPSIFDINEDVISALEYRKKLVGYMAVVPLIEE